MNNKIEYDCPHLLCDSKVKLIKGKKGPLFLCEKCGEEGRNKFIPSIDGRPAHIMICLHAGCPGWVVQLYSKKNKECFFYCEECKKAGRYPYFEDVDGWPHTDSPLQRPKHRCAHEDCEGMAEQYKRTKDGVKFWICRVCDEAGRNKFYKDDNYKPVI